MMQLFIYATVYGSDGLKFRQLWSLDTRRLFTWFSYLLLCVMSFFAVFALYLFLDMFGVLLLWECLSVTLRSMFALCFFFFFFCFFFGLSISYTFRMLFCDNLFLYLTVIIIVIFLNPCFDCNVMWWLPVFLIPDCTQRFINFSFKSLQL